MIPLKDANPAKNPAVVTYTLIAFNLVAYLYQLSLGGTGSEADMEALNKFIHHWGVVPLYLKEAFESKALQPDALSPLLTHMFLHGSVLHVGLNVWFLHIFGNNVEDHMGSWRFLFFYLAGGVIAAVTHVVVIIEQGTGDLTTPMVGASGAIAAVMGAYWILYPKAKIKAIIPPWLRSFNISAFWFLLIWFGLQLLNVFIQYLAIVPFIQAQAIAFWAHIGGFIAGVVLVNMFFQKRHVQQHRKFGYVLERDEALVDFQKHKADPRRFR